jgi:hypothetical protein
MQTIAPKCSNIEHLAAHTIRPLLAFLLFASAIATTTLAVQATNIDVAVDTRQSPGLAEALSRIVTNVVQAELSKIKLEFDDQNGEFSVTKVEPLPDANVTFEQTKLADDELTATITADMGGNITGWVSALKTSAVASSRVTARLGLSIRLCVRDEQFKILPKIDSLKLDPQINSLTLGDEAAASDDPILRLINESLKDIAAKKQDEFLSAANEKLLAESDGFRFEGLNIAARIVSGADCGAPGDASNPVLRSLLSSVAHKALSETYSEKNAVTQESEDRIRALNGPLSIDITVKLRNKFWLDNPNQALDVEVNKFELADGGRLHFALRCKANLAADLRASVERRASISLRPTATTRIEVAGSLLIGADRILDPQISVTSAIISDLRIDNQLINQFSGLIQGAMNQVADEKRSALAEQIGKSLTEVRW